MKLPEFHFQKIALYGGLALFCAVQGLLIWKYESEARKIRPTPDEARTASILLAGKLSGPGYFKFESENKDIVFPFISRSSAKAQVDRIVRERGFTPEITQRLEQLVDGLVQEPSSRMTGQEMVDGLRLNLALEELASKP
jgi:hypothetical protein